ncbi:30S ribosomal protein S20 [Rhodocaloribacter litoris]|uniref:30S ribosomal protein S20 n=1 Tax=Rhodocaloribacter litoris TaxID=2558931 RepID=UPI00141E951E|nr:30S ribosomal protein S20 [Rhodocaloribacter litoris]QXD13994.1 30S ribosomal protein S20 [Rhodocaloribacter litoris]
MPQHKSAIKRTRQNARRRARNRLHRSKMRTLIKKLRTLEDRAQAERLLNEVKAYLDRLASRGIIHKNKAANYKSKLEKKVHALG